MPFKFDLKICVSFGLGIKYFTLQKKKKKNLKGESGLWWANEFY